MAVLDLVAEALPQSFDVEFEIGARPPLDRAIERRTGARGLVIFDERPIGQTARVGAWRDEIGIGNDRIEVVQLRVREIEQSAHFAVADVPPVGYHDVAVRVPTARLTRVQLPERSVQLEAFEVERTTRADVDQTGDARFDKIGGRRLESFERGDGA